LRIFVTGATGFIGSKLVVELLAAGYGVLGLTRSEAGAMALHAAGAEVQVGSVQDLDSLRAAAAKSDGVIHLAFNNDFSQFPKASEDDVKAIQAIGEVLVDSTRPFVVTSPTAVAMRVDGKPVTEEGPLAPWNPRAASEIAIQALAAHGVKTSIVRLSQVHDTHKQGAVTPAVEVARDKGQSCYVRDGSNRWAAVHLADAVRLYRLAFEKAEAGAIYHAVAEEGVPMKEIAEAIGRGLNIPVASIKPEEVEAHFGPLGVFMGLDLSASSAITRKKLNWHPAGPGLIADLDAMNYAQDGYPPATVSRHPAKRLLYLKEHPAEVVKLADTPS
jgi:nucleoside-diphosphate-sugar epimerase